MEGQSVQHVLHSQPLFYQNTIDSIKSTKVYAEPELFFFLVHSQYSSGEHELSLDEEQKSIDSVISHIDSSVYVQLHQHAAAAKMLKKDPEQYSRKSKFKGNVSLKSQNDKRSQLHDLHAMMILY